MSERWEASAEAWLRAQGDDGDWGRRAVLDAPMRARVRGRGFARAVDIGCGEGRFCRALQAEGIATIGVDPTRALLAEARRRDPAGDYREGRGEALPVDTASCDLAVFYLSLIDIPDLPAALREAHRVLRPGGALLIANLQSFNTAGGEDGWRRGADGALRFTIEGYLDERPVRAAWKGIDILNYHRPLEAYLGGLLALGFALRHFAEPAPAPDDPKAARYRHAPHFLVMEWERGAG